MMLGVQLCQSLIGDMGVNLRSREVAMAEQHLYHAQICTVVEQMCGESMAQRVRRQWHLQLNLRSIVFNTIPECLARH